MTLGTCGATGRRSSLVDLAANGSRIRITGRGRRVAFLFSGVEETAKSGDDPVAVFRAIYSRTMSLKSVNLKALVEEGRA